MTFLFFFPFTIILLHGLLMKIKKMSIHQISLYNKIKINVSLYVIVLLLGLI